MYSCMNVVYTYTHRYEFHVHVIATTIGTLRSMDDLFIIFRWNGAAKY